MSDLEFIDPFEGGDGSESSSDSTVETTVSARDTGNLGILHIASKEPAMVRIEAVNKELVLFTKKGQRKLEMEPIESVVSWTATRNPIKEAMIEKRSKSPFWAGTAKVGQKIIADVADKMVRRHLADRHATPLSWLNSPSGEVPRAAAFHLTIDHSQLSHTHGTPEEKGEPE